MHLTQLVDGQYVTYSVYMNINLSLQNLLRQLAILNHAMHLDNELIVDTCMYMIPPCDASWKYLMAFLALG